MGIVGATFVNNRVDTGDKPGYRNRMLLGSHSILLYKKILTS